VWVIWNKLHLIQRKRNKAQKNPGQFVEQNMVHEGTLLVCIREYASRTLEGNKMEEQTLVIGKRAEKKIKVTNKSSKDRDGNFPSQGGRSCRKIHKGGHRNLTFGTKSLLYGNGTT
jgi:hypothetical protein